MKIKAYDTENKKWIKHFFIRNEDSAILERLPNKLGNEGLRLVTGQLFYPTGYKDFLDREIYTGDIVCLKHEVGYRTFSKEYRLVNCVSDISCYFEYETNTSDEACIVGNIYSKNKTVLEFLGLK